MELEIKRETLRFERPAGMAQEQVTIEGEATLPGSMRDAVTVLSVQAQTHITGAKAAAGEALIRGRAQFQVIYTQGDLTRLRTLETGCDFECGISMEGLTPQMHVYADVAVQETEGTAASGRMTLRALLNIQTEAFETMEREWITDTAPQNAADMQHLQKKTQQVEYCVRETLGENRTLVRQEFELPARLEIGDVISATATAGAEEFTGGNGRIGVSGVVQVRVLHRPAEAGRALVMTQHDLPFEMTLEGYLPEGAQPQAKTDVLDVMADSARRGDARLLRVEAQVRVALNAFKKEEKQLLEDVYSLEGPELETAGEDVEIHTASRCADVRESLRLQASLPSQAPPIGTVMAAFALPDVLETAPAGRRLNVSGVMNLTLIYLPIDSDIPCSVKTREPFSMTFPAEAEDGIRAQAYAIETTPGTSTSDRAEVRCVLGLRTAAHDVKRIRGVSGIEQRPPRQMERGFVLVWPPKGETRWDTARKLRVTPESLKPAGKHALLAFRK